MLSDQPPAAPQDRKVYSPNKRFYAFLSAKNKTTACWRVKDKVKLWEMPGWFRVAALADDGRHLVTGYDGANLIPIQHDPKMVMLTFYRDGAPFRAIPLNELIRDLGQLRPTASHYSWGNFAGLESGYHFRVDTVDRGTLHFDLRSGEIAPLPPPPRKTRD